MESSGVLQTPNWSRVLIEHMNRGVFQSPVGTSSMLLGMCLKVERSAVELWSESLES